MQEEENETDLENLREEFEKFSRGANRESTKTRKIVKDVLKGLSDLKNSVDEHKYVVNKIAGRVPDLGTVMERIKNEVLDLDSTINGSEN